MVRKKFLNGTWSFSEAGSNNWKNGTVPGCIQLDLLESGELPDPFYRMNEAYMKELEKKEWIYKREYNLSKDDITGCSKINLVFEGVDTFSHVYVNSIYAGSTQNMFIPYTYDITNLVVEGKNIVEMIFDSTVKNIYNMKGKSPIAIDATCERARPYARKAQYSFGWDWGPRIPQVGLWRQVYIEFVKNARINNCYFFTEKLSENIAKVRIKADMEMYVQNNVEADIEVYLNKVLQVKTPASIRNIKGVFGIDEPIQINHPQIWYPNGLGKQPLYEVIIRLHQNGNVITEKAFRAGIRTVKIIQEPDLTGKKFIFEVNGIKVFAKGANWIPPDSLLPRVKWEDYYKYIQLAKEANMNMIRVWGGGIYEDSAFYSACDEMGIMVWQDFMYSCAQYPDEMEWFRKLAAEEAEIIVKKLRNHPSIVLWCGNNENNWGFVDWWGNGIPKYYGNYIYREILPQVCAELDPSRPYWVSSPYGGEHPNGMKEGDRHSWSVWSEWEDYEEYKNDTGRFISEFGFQAMPDWRTVVSYSEDTDRHVFSPVMISHNKNMEGMEKLVRFLVARIGFPKDFNSFVYLTQFNQAEAIKTGVEHWRSRKFMTAGTLYWQFNDCWPAASWSCVDYCKRKKALYHYTKRFFAQILPLVKREEHGIAVYVISDLLQEVTGKVRLSMYSLNGRKIYEEKFEVNIIPNDITKAKNIEFSEIEIGNTPRLLPVDGFCTNAPEELNGNLIDTCVYIDVKVEDEVFLNYLLFDKFRNLNIQKPVIDLEVIEDKIVMKTDKPAFGVFIETDNEIDLSDNCIFMEPGKEYVLECSEVPLNTVAINLHGLTQKL